MNVLLWILQILLALHTFIGATWKTSNSEVGIEALQRLPHSLWLALIALELLCSVALVIPAFLKKPLRKLVPVAAVCVAVEMLLFCAMYAASGAREFGEPIYWMTVAAIGAFIAYGRWRLKPL